MRWNREVGVACIAAALGLAGGFLGQSFAGREEEVLAEVGNLGWSSTEEEGEVLVGAGDIAACDNTGDEATAELLDRIPGTVFTMGDNVYESGTAGEFYSCYNPTWGRHKDRTRPSIGNHDYGNEGYEDRSPGSYDATGYFSYFGEAAGDPDKGYYSYDLGDWHVISLNSMCELVGGCGPDSPQIEWLKEDLESSDARCVLAYWHHPVFSSGYHEDHSRMRPAWKVLYDHGAELVVNGHDHVYERFAPQTPEGEIDHQSGIREFIVGTGGRSLRGFNDASPNSEMRGEGAYGLIKFTLRSDGYDWEFVGIEGSTFADSGSGDCH